MTFITVQKLFLAIYNLRSKSSPFSTSAGFATNPCKIFGMHSDAFLPRTVGVVGTFFLHPRMSFFLLNDDLKHLLRLTKSQFIIREEEHSDSIFSFFSNIDIGCPTGFAKELMRNLKHDSYTISCLSCCIFTCTML